jgi:hypothetical protein
MMENTEEVIPLAKHLLEAKIWFKETDLLCTHTNLARVFLSEVCAKLILTDPINTEGSQ